jgi:Uma2 family endonuclease
MATSMNQQLTHAGLLTIVKERICYYTTEVVMTTPTVEIEPPPAALPTAVLEAEDPFRYGWRWVPNDAIDGRHKLRAIPLTLEDVLHPEEGDEIMHSEAHERRRIYLYEALMLSIKTIPDAIVLSDVRIAWDVPELKAHGPDLMVIFGVGERKNWTTFNVATEKVRPALIIEVVSPEYANLDRSTKLEHYDRAGVPVYVILDTVVAAGNETIRLLAYARRGERYHGLPPDERGRIWLDVVQLWLSIEDNELVIYDAHDQVVPNFVGMAEARQQAEQRATDAEQRATDAEQRATDAEQRAVIEAERRAELETQLQAMAAELERLRPKNEHP